jgi:hypothetical protein
MEKRLSGLAFTGRFLKEAAFFYVNEGEGESIRKPSAAERARFLSASREESAARTGSGFFSRGKIRVFRRDSPEPLRSSAVPRKTSRERRKKPEWSEDISES